MSWLRLTCRLTGFMMVLTIAAVFAVGLNVADRLTGHQIPRTFWARACFYLAARSLGFRIELSGKVADSPVLFVSNHISWSDIPVLGGLAPMRFLSKSEVRRWPFIGWLAEQAGTLFIQRGGGRAAHSRQEITNALRRGESVLVFPEGTTSAGIGVLPFHGRLLKAAVDAGVPIQPVSIGYLRDGKADPVAPFIGDDDFRDHLVRMLKLPAAHIVVHVHEPVQAGEEDTMASLAARLREQVAGGLANLKNSDYPPTGIRPNNPEFSSVGAPAQLHRRSLPAFRQFPDQSTE